MKKRTVNTKSNSIEAEKKKQLAYQIKTLRPHITDTVHMRAAIILGCEYKAIGSYLEGKIIDVHFAEALIDLFKVILKTPQNAVNKDAEEDKTGDILRVAMLVLQTNRTCKAIIDKLDFMEKTNHEAFQCMQASLNGVALNKNT